MQWGTYLREESSLITILWVKSLHYTLNDNNIMLTVKIGTFDEH